VNSDSAPTDRATGASSETRPGTPSRPRAVRRWTLETVTVELTSLRWLPAPLAVLPIAALRYLYQNCIQWAGSLAYYTLLGIVPVLAVTFSLMKGIGYHRELTPFVISTIGAGSPEVAAQIVDFIDNTNVRAVAVFSALGAFLALLAIMMNAEMCFNAIWGGVPGRTVRRKMQSFAKVALIAPLLLLLALAITAFMQPGQRAYAFLDSLYLGDAVLVLLPFVPYALLWVSFTLLYTGLPNTQVRRRSAIVGAVIAGTLWQLAQWAYVTFVIRMVRYSAVYGALWQIPILLAWIYIAWSIIVYGCQVTRAHQEIVATRRAARAAS